jgi:hypothetical protein
MVQAVDILGRSVLNTSIGILAGLDLLGKGKQNLPSLPHCNPICYTEIII